MGEDIQNLFRRCMTLRQALRRLELQAARVQEIAMNGSVAAGQTGHQARVYGEIAQQVAVAGRRMGEQTKACRVEVDGIASLTLRALVLERHHGKYAEAAPAVRGEGNRTRLAEVMASLRVRIADVLCGVPGHVGPVEAALRNLVQTQDRLFSLVTKLRVEAVDLGGSQATAIFGLGDRLGAGIEDATAVLNDLSILVRLVRDEACRVSTFALGEGSDAPVRAA